MRVVITGGAGFIGSYVAEAFARRGCHVCVFDNLSSGSINNLHPSWQFFEGDVRDLNVVDEVIEGTDVVVHLAAFTSMPESFEEFRDCYDVNVAGTYNVLEACRNNDVRRVVFASSSAVYAELPDQPKTEKECPKPISPYAVSKLEGEHLLQLFEKSHGLSTLALRFFNVYGPRQPLDSDYAAVIPLFIQSSLESQTLTIYGDGSQTRDFVFVRDVAEAVYQAANASVTGVCNVGTGRAVKVLEIATAISELACSDQRYTFESPRLGDVCSSTADISEIRHALHWSPVYSLEEGLEETLEWYRELSKSKELCT